MISIDVRAGSPREILVDVGRRLSPLTRRRLNAVLAQRLVNELQDHFRTRNAEPNKQGWAKTGFYAQVSRSTGVSRADENGAEVTIADQRFRIHVFGGTIKPTGGRKFLTIPLIPAARGLNVDSYERKSRKKLFRLPGVKLLFERSSQGTQSIVGTTKARRWDARSQTASDVTVRAKTAIRPVYALAREAKIPRDDAALPPAARIEAALLEEASDLLERNFRRGTRA